MAKILLVTIIISMAFSALMLIFVRSGENFATRYPGSRFAKWFRKHIIDQNPWEN